MGEVWLRWRLFWIYNFINGTRVLLIGLLEVRKLLFPMSQ
jgi:hypothetical protein